MEVKKYLNVKYWILLCNAQLASREIVCELHKTACPGCSGVRTLCEPPLKLASLRIINKRKFCLNLVCPINVQKFSSLGWHIFMSLIQILVKRHTQHMQYLLDLLGIKSSGFLAYLLFE